MPELIDGQLVERPPMGQESDAVAARIIRLVGNHADLHRLGVVNGAQGGFQSFPDDPNKVRIPDVSFTRRERFPEARAAAGHAKVVPDLVVEVVSPNDLAFEVSAKVRDFLGAGVPLVWVANPETRDVLVYRGDGSGALLRSGDHLDGRDILPGFQCPVDDLFAIGFDE
jgi:Uma2 family endonuclease